jgi:hypothetical protein
MLAQLFFAPLSGAAPVFVASALAAELGAGFAATSPTFADACAAETAELSTASVLAEMSWVVCSAVGAEMSVLSFAVPLVVA